MNIETYTYNINDNKKLKYIKRQESKQRLNEPETSPCYSRTVFEKHQKSQLNQQSIQLTRQQIAMHGDVAIEDINLEVEGEVGGRRVKRGVAASSSRIIIFTIISNEETK